MPGTQQVVTLLLMVMVTVARGAKDANGREDLTPAAYGPTGLQIPLACPGIPEMGVEIMLHLSGRSILPFSPAERDILIASLADLLATAGVPNKLYLRIKEVTEIYSGGHTRLESDVSQTIQVLLVIMLPSKVHGGNVVKMLSSKKGCSAAVNGFNGTSGLVNVKRCWTTDAKKLFPPVHGSDLHWSRAWVWIFLLGNVLGASLTGCIIWGGHKYVSSRRMQREVTYNRKRSLSLIDTHSINPTFDLAFKHSNRSAVRFGDRFRQSTLEKGHGDPMWKKVCIDEVEQWRHRLLLCCIYFEEIVPNCLSSYNSRMRTRVLHRKLKVRGVPMCQDSGTDDPIFLLYVNPRYCLHIDMRKDESDTEHFPFGCIDHIVVTCPDGSSHRLPLVTLMSGNNSQCRHRYRAAAVWDPSQQGSEALFSKATQSSRSIPLEISIAFRVFGFHMQGQLCYVTRTVQVRMRGKGEVRHVDKPYHRSDNWMEKAPEWATEKAKGVATLLGLTPPLDPLLTM
ncbi:hypothetical protein BSKO_11810 [Bryopsis sp. KO-2023]|nr:hypothetical protein BSKO_11810 [Bryopsis sp. KO-2023]